MQLFKLTYGDRSTYVLADSLMGIDGLVKAERLSDYRIELVAGDSSSSKFVDVRREKD